MLSKSRFRRHEKFINNSSPHRLCSPIALFLAGQHLYLHFRRCHRKRRAHSRGSRLQLLRNQFGRRGYDQHPRHSGMERARKWVLQHRSIRRARGQQQLGTGRQGSPNERNLFSGLRQLAEDCGRSKRDPQAAPTELEEGVELSSG